MICAVKSAPIKLSRYHCHSSCELSPAECTPNQPPPFCNQASKAASCSALSMSPRRIQEDHNLKSLQIAFVKYRHRSRYERYPTLVLEQWTRGMLPHWLYRLDAEKPLVLVNKSIPGGSQIGGQLRGNCIVMRRTEKTRFHAPTCQITASAIIAIIEATKTNILKNLNNIFALPRPIRTLLFP